MRAMDSHLTTGSDGSTIRGLTINRFGDAGIKLNGSDNHTIVGNWIGTDADGYDRLRAIRPSESKS